VVEAIRFQALELRVTGRRRQHEGAGALGELNRRDADAARPGMDQHGLTRAQAAELEQAIIRRPDGDRHAGAELQIEPVW